MAQKAYQVSPLRQDFGGQASIKCQGMVSALMNLASHFPSRISKSGFSLIELLIVITIMAILASALFVLIDPIKRKSQTRDVARKSDIGQLGNALKAYYTEKDEYPLGSGLGNSSGLTALVANEDLKLIPLDPLGNEYYYNVTGSGVSSNAALHIDIEDPTSGSGNWDWCFRTSDVSVREVEDGTCLP